MRKDKRGGVRLVGCALGVLLAALLLMLFAKGLFGAVMGGLSLLRETDVESSATAQPTVPPFEEMPGIEETAPPFVDPVEVPVEKTPEELAETAVDLTPPPDAPIG